MSSVLSSLSVKQKLYAPSVLVVVLAVVIALFFSEITSESQEAEESITSSQEQVQAIYRASEQMELFSTTEKGYEGLVSSIAELQSAVDSSVELQQQGVVSSIAAIKPEVDRIEQLFQSNRQIEKEMAGVVALSIKQSNDYISALSVQLADAEQRFKVTTFERQVIGPALSHTNNNYRILLIFQRIRQDLTVADELISYLDELDAASDQAIVDLEGTPMYEKAKAAREANGQIRELAMSYIENRKSINELKQSVEGVLSGAIQQVQQHAETDIQESMAGISTSLTQIMVITMTLVVAVVVLSILFARSIAGPLAELRRRISALASSGGDLSYRIDLHRRDEIGKLAQGINEFLGVLQEIFAGIATQGQTISKYAQSASETSAATLEHMNRQGQETSKVVLAFSEMNGAIQEIAGSATSASDRVQQANNRSSLVVDSLNKTIDNIQGLGSDLKVANDVIQQLNSDSQNIGGILDVIRGIADQTNLLALNAAIEAARAGEQGRGFAVVADEVRSLAQRTQSSIQEIHEMIESLQQASERATQVITKGNEQVELTASQGEEAGQGVGDISALISDIAQMNLQVASAVEEQSSVINNINESIQQIQQLTEEGSQSAGSSADSARNQADAVESMLGMIQKFRA